MIDIYNNDDNNNDNDDDKENVNNDFYDNRIKKILSQGWQDNPIAVSI